MSQLHQYAKVIIMKAMNRKHNRGAVAAFYGIPPDIVEWYLTGRDCGTLHAREVIRVEIARLEAEKAGVWNFHPTNKDRYKGTRYE